MSETFLSVDIECDGVVPGRNSMLSIAAVAFKLDRTILGKFTRNVTPLPDANPDPRTMKWWESFPDAWAACHTDPVEPKAAMEDFLAFTKGLPDLPAIFVADPVSFDWIFVHWYLHTFTDYLHIISENTCLATTALDLRSFSMATLNKPFLKSGTRKWREAHSFPHTHVALDDAMEQAMTFCAMHEAMERLHSRGNVFVPLGGAE